MRNPIRSGKSPSSRRAPPGARPAAGGVGPRQAQLGGRPALLRRPGGGGAAELLPACQRVGRGWGGGDHVRTFLQQSLPRQFSNVCEIDSLDLVDKYRSPRTSHPPCPTPLAVSIHFLRTTSSAHPPRKTWCLHPPRAQSGIVVEYQ